MLRIRQGIKQVNKQIKIQTFTSFAAVPHQMHTYTSSLKKQTNKKKSYRRVHSLALVKDFKVLLHQDKIKILRSVSQVKRA